MTYWNLRKNILYNAVFPYKKSEQPNEIMGNNSKDISNIIEKVYQIGVNQKTFDCCGYHWRAMYRH